jgi:hypothetical protein
VLHVAGNIGGYLLAPIDHLIEETFHFGVCISMLLAWHPGYHGMPHRQPNEEGGGYTTGSYTQQSDH